MNPQPKALVLADALDAEFVQGRISNSTGRESAVELRRLQVWDLEAMRQQLHDVLAAKLPGRDFRYFLTQRGMFRYTGL